MPPGAKKRISMLFCGQRPGTSGQTGGRISSDTKISADTSSLAVKGSRISSTGGFRAASSMRAKAMPGTACLSPGIGNPPSAM